MLIKEREKIEKKTKMNIIENGVNMLIQRTYRNPIHG